MRNNNIQTRFQPDIHFEVAPVAAVPFRGAQETDLERLKTKLLRELLHQAPDSSHYAPLRRAANEAAALAWFTPFPLLVFPLLLEEKALSIQEREIRQKRIRLNSQHLVAAAVARSKRLLRASCLQNPALAAKRGESGRKTGEGSLLNLQP